MIVSEQAEVEHGEAHVQSVHCVHLFNENYAILNKLPIPIDHSNCQLRIPSTMIIFLVQCCTNQIKCVKLLPAPYGKKLF